VSRLFNAYVIIDWSAAAKPATGPDSVWIGVMKRDVRFRLTFEAFNPSTRLEAETKLAAILDDMKKRGERALVGFDFPLGFPRGFAAQLKMADVAPWRGAWDLLDKLVKDKADNSNNRFIVGGNLNRQLTGSDFPFWGCPPRDANTNLQPKRSRPHGDGDLPEFRHADEAAKGASSIWKLYYNGSVGGQALVGIPFVSRLKKARRERVKIWPFETGFEDLAKVDLTDVDAVVTEVYPSLYKAQPGPGEVKDMAQVRATAEHFAKLDEAGKLGAIFAAPASLDEAGLAAAASEEGWVLGV
jgi:hypothetical protein